MNVLSLFDGMSVGQIALEKVGINVDNYFASEIDPHAIKVTQSNYPNTQQIGSVLELKGSDLPKIDILIGGSPCFVKGTKIMTEIGYKNIEDIIVGDSVLTHLNRWNKVLKIGGDIKNTIQIEAQGMKSTITTKNHPYYVKSMTRKWNNSKRTYERVFSEPIWKKAGNLEKGDFLALPIIKDSENPRKLNEEDCWLIGRYIADGHLRKYKRKNRKESYNYGVIYSIGDEKLDYFKSKINRNMSIYPHSKSVHRCVLNSMDFVNMLIDMKVGRGAENKIIPMELLKLPKNLLKNVIEGYLSGDGSFNEETNNYSANSVSENLIMTLNIAIAKVYKTSSTYGFLETSPTHIVEDRIVNQKNVYYTRFSKEMKKQNNSYVTEKNIWLPFKSRENLNTKQEVFNIEVENDNSYIANNIVVHNCQGFSFAGKMMNFEDPRSKLFFEFVRLKEETKPQYFLLENVNMKKEYQDIISEYLGVQPIKINSNLLTASNRNRLYWTNIPGVEVPEDKGLYFDSIHEENEDWLEPARIEMIRAWKAQQKPLKSAISLGENKKVPCLTARGFNQYHSGMILVNSGDKFRYLTRIEGERAQTVPEGYTREASLKEAARMLGNGWTVDVIAHIFKNLK